MECFFFNVKIVPWLENGWKTSSKSQFKAVATQKKLIGHGAMKQRQNPNTNAKLRLKLMDSPTTYQVVALPGAAPGPSCPGWSQKPEAGGALSFHPRPPRGRSVCEMKRLRPGGNVAQIHVHPHPFLLLQSGPWAEGQQDGGSAGPDGAVRYRVGQRQIHRRTVRHKVQAGRSASSRVASAVAAAGAPEHCRGTAGRKGAAPGPDWRRSCSHPSPLEHCDEGSVLGTSRLR